MANNLSEYYQSQGQALPSLQQRQGVASQAGIQNYSGTAEQNNQLLGYLQNQPAVPTAPTSVPVSNVITPTSLQNQTPITVPQATIPPVPPPIPTVPTPTETALSALDLTANEKSAQSAQENIVVKMLENITNQQGESAYRTDLTNQSGIGQQRQELLTLSNQIRTKQAEIAQDDITLISKMRAEENRDTLLPFAQNAQAKIAGDASIIRALKTSEIGVLNALAIGKQGDIQLAKDTINEAVDAKFAPYKEQNALYEAQLKAIQPFLDKAEKKQALLQQTKLNLAMKEIDKVADFQKTALANAISNNAPQSVLNKINSATTIDQITSIGAGYLENRADKLSNSLKQMQINELSNKISENLEKSGVSAKDLPLIVKSASDKINKIQGLIDNTKGLTSSSGILKRAAGFSGKIRDWRADISNVLSDLTVDELGRVKASGVTFGALSEGERKAVGDAASALSAAGSVDSSGRLTGYFNISEDKVRQELKTIQDYAKIDFERRTGVSYDDYIAAQNAPITEDAYVSSLLSSQISSPFNIFSTQN